jgi:hypothetical protein
MSLSNKLYYQIKPFIPRWVQIQVRRQVALRKRVRYADVWPIDPNAGNPPEGWRGWPDGKKFALVLHHDVDTAKGHQKCHHLIKLEEKMGFRSSFNFVPERYNVSGELRKLLVEKGFEVSVHGLKHDGKLFSSRKAFEEQAVRINHYLKEWQSVGFVSPSMHCNLNWVSELEIIHDSSTFDTDPFEPQPDGVSTIFPFYVPANHNSQIAAGLKSETKTAALQHRNTAAPNNPINPTNLSREMQPALFSMETTSSGSLFHRDQLNSKNPPTSNLQPSTSLSDGFIELPYTLPQDFTLFVLMKERNINIWKQKLDWIVRSGGMALLITHPDYMNCEKGMCSIEEYPMEFYEELLDYIKSKYEGQYWHPLPKEIARFWVQLNGKPNNIFLKF